MHQSHKTEKTIRENNNEATVLKPRDFVRSIENLTEILQEYSDVTHLIIKLGEDNNYVK